MEGDAATPASRPPSGSAKPASDRPTFAHASEAEFARILDFYEVRWQYEPHTFPILWNLDGVVVESFSPDFYLPDFDTYFELTTLRQPLVRKKNRKLRRLRELYPDIRIKLFYARDFRALMLKYGKLGLVDALSGTPGQVPPSRVRQAGGGSTSVTADELAVEAEPPVPGAEPAVTATTSRGLPDGPDPVAVTPHGPRRRGRPTAAVAPSIPMTGPDA